MLAQISRGMKTLKARNILLAFVSRFLASRMLRASSAIRVLIFPANAAVLFKRLTRLARDRQYISSRAVIRPEEIFDIIIRKLDNEDIFEALLVVGKQNLYSLDGTVMQGPKRGSMDGALFALLLDTAEMINHNPQKLDVLRPADSSEVIFDDTVSTQHGGIVDVKELNQSLGYESIMADDEEKPEEEPAEEPAQESEEDSEDSEAS